MLVSTYEAEIPEGTDKINTEISYILGGNLKTVKFSIPLEKSMSKPIIKENKINKTKNNEKKENVKEKKENFFTRLIKSLIGLFS